jgi:prepilin-type N-terminal cleavage/methylation domain-containing protein
MIRKLKSREKTSGDGFTIIEVLIVLAIAGLILLIVFLAVPALERNARNTERKNDVSSILSAISEYESNNDGQLPTTSGNFSTEFSGENPKLGYYTTAANVYYNYSATTLTTVPANPGSPDKVEIYNGVECDATNDAPSLSGASARSVIALYDIETSGNTAEQCVSS